MTTPNTNTPAAPDAANAQQAAAQNRPGAAGNPRPNMTKMYLSQAYTHTGNVYGPGEADVPEGDAARDIQQKEDDYQQYLKEGGQPLPPVTPGSGDAPHYDPRIRRPGNVSPPREVLQAQGRGADVPVTAEQRDAAAKEAADRAGDEDRTPRRAGTAMDEEGQRKTTRETAKGGK
jgi:hypothetical protein